MRAQRIAVGLSLALSLAASAVARGSDFVIDADLKRLDLQRFWHLRLPLEGGESVTRMALVEDTVYAMTSANRALSIHSGTGVVRWSNFVADEGQTVRGPSHASKYVFFTTPGAVRVFDRQTGELAGQPRTLRGVVIEVISETVTISIGEEHGVQLGDVLNIYHGNELGDKEGPVLAVLKVTSVQRRTSRGRMERMSATEKPKSGDKVEADVNIPLQEVKLPFAASSAAVSDNKRIYVGAANQRFYALDMLSGVQIWQLSTPQTVSASPVILKDTLYIAGQDGQVISCTRDEKAKNWTFATEAPIFADIVVTESRVFVASTDRSLYCIDRLSGRRIWRERFDTPLNTSPIVAGNNVYQLVPDQGLIVLDAESGKRVWKRPEGGRLLGQMGDDAYLIGSDGSPEILRVSAANGRKKEEAPAAMADFALAGLASQSMFLGNASGDVVCLRPASAPRLKVEHLQEALRVDRKVQLAAEMDAKIKSDEAKKKAAMAQEPKKRGLFDDDTGLASRSTAKPVGGHGLIKPKEEPTTTSQPADADTEKTAEEPAAEGEAAEKTEDAEEKKADEESDDEDADAKKDGEEKKDADDEDAKEGDEEGDKAKEGEKKDDEKASDDEEEEDEDEGDKAKDEEKPGERDEKAGEKKKEKDEDD